MATTQPAKGVRGLPIPRDIDEKLRPGRKAMLRDAPSRRLCHRFEKGDTYWYQNEKGMLLSQSLVTAANGSGKPRHRVRAKVNFIRPIIEAKVSAATQRIPSYDVAPSTTDPKAEGAARMSEAVALYGYDKWRLRRASVKAVKLALTSGDAFAIPYFDQNVGPYIEVNGRMVGQGEVRVMVVSGNELYWQAGVDFEDSAFYAVERAQPLDEVKRLPGFIPGLALAADANTADVPTDKMDRDNLVMVTDYYERPCPRYPRGRTMHFANGQCVTDARLTDPGAKYAWEDYPVRDADGTVLDEPVAHRLTYSLDPLDDRDLGLVWQLIDPQRTAQDAWNKAVEWKNRCLFPQMIAPVGSLIDRRSDTPGETIYYRAVGGLKPEWEQVQPIPDSLFRIYNEALDMMRAIAADIDLDGANAAAARTLQQVIEQSANRWQSFLGDLAEWHSRLMRHCLCLVARHYTEPRLLQIRGRFGPYSIKDFQGAQLMGQVAVTVLPGSLQVRTREQITQQVLAFADRGWVSPQVAMAAIQGGTAEKLIESFELDVARANRVIQAIVDKKVMDLGTWIASDPMSGQPAKLPVYMPRDVDNLEIWESVFGDWSKTEQYQGLGPEGQEVVNQITAGIQMLKAQAQQRMLEAQNAQAAQLGMSNAAKPQDKGMPDLPGGTTSQAPPGPPPA